MRLQRDSDTLLLSCNQPEAELLRRVFRQLAESYRPTPAELDATTAIAWYCTRGCATAKMSEAETAEWLEEMHAFKSARLERLADWSRQLGALPMAAGPSPMADSQSDIGHRASAIGKASGPAQLRVAATDAPTFIASINDYRLLAAARHHIGQAEMDLHWPWQWAKLPAARREALLEIHFLALVLEETLHALQDKAGG
jgi:hypothetical protein